MGLFTGRLVRDGHYRPSLLHRVLKPRVSGNDLNGFGLREKVRPKPVYHRTDIKNLPWKWVQLFFYLRVGRIRVFREFLREHMELQKRKSQPVAPKREADTPSGWSLRLKAFALSQEHCKIVGIARVNHEWVTEGDTIAEPWVVVMGTPMDYSEIVHAPSHRSQAAILAAYLKSERVAIAVADWIRAWGWQATAHGGPAGGPLVVIPHAIAAGLGELGKHGSMMNRDLGSCFRMSYVLTDMPLVAGEAEEIGVDEFCASCQLCTTGCPPGAIFDAKQWVRGDFRWYVDFDKCIPYFNDQWGCQICLAVCPWSRPSLASSLSQKMLKKKASKSGRAREIVASGG
jgi:Pyruvate/2-oxoacid:ferredoxin oxidoreductase delta subunit